MTSFVPSLDEAASWMAMKLGIEAQPTALSGKIYLVDWVRPAGQREIFARVVNAQGKPGKIPAAEWVKTHPENAAAYQAFREHVATEPDSAIEAEKARMAKVQADLKRSDAAERERVSFSRSWRESWAEFWGGRGPLGQAGPALKIGAAVVAAAVVVMIVGRIASRPR